MNADREPAGGRAVRADPLPRLMVILDASSPRSVPEVAAGAAAHGARGFVLRARELPPREQAELAAALRAVLPPGCLLIQAGGSGPAVHLASAAAFPHPRPALVGRSCHHAADLDRALNEKCDYVFVSPVYETPSKPGYGPPLGPVGLAALCPPGLPVYALGGVRPDRVAECRRAGAFGVAVMGPVRHDPPIVAAYLAALSEVSTP